MPFIPRKLPPKIDYTKLIQEIGLAHNNLGKLNGLLINLKRLTWIMNLIKIVIFSEEGGKRFYYKVIKETL